MRTFTVAIATYRRRDVVVRLVSSLSRDLERAGDLAAGVDLMVVVDGSTDGTVEALEALRTPVPLRVVWHENAGLAATRQRTLEQASGEVVWFLDDDVVPADGTFARHRTAHEPPDPPHVLVGPCVLPPDAPTVPALRAHYDRLWAELSQRTRVDRFDRFSAANTSGPVALLRDAGGFDERFRGYGREDFDLGHRLLSAGVRIDFDAAAVAWHHQERTVAEFLRNAVSEGTNTVHLVRLHPETADVALPGQRLGRSYRVLERLRVRDPRALLAVARAAGAAASVEGRRGGVRFLELAYTAAFAAGVARADRSLVDRIFAAPGRS